MVAQDDPVLGDVDANQATIRSTIERAKRQDADILVFPELFLTGYHIDEDPENLTAEAARALDELESLTEDLIVVVGTPTESESEIYNSAVVIEDGETTGAYHKTHLFGVEPDVFTPGDQFPTFETDIGTIGLEICYDVEYPEVARQLTLNGADIIVTISANMRPCVRDQELYHGTRALENGRPHILCNRVGEERGVDFFGESGIVDRRGRRILSLGADRTEAASAAIEMETDRTDLHDYLGDRRPELYDLGDRID
mgnify:CR=1 FL=1